MLSWRIMKIVLRAISLLKSYLNDISQFNSQAKKKFLFLIFWQRQFNQRNLVPKNSDANCEVFILISNALVTKVPVWNFAIWKRLNCYIFFTFKQPVVFHERTAKITPVQKKNNGGTSVKHFIPIASLTAFSKIVEIIIRKDQLTSYVGNPFCPSSFQRHYTTTSLILSLTHDNGNYLSTAFDFIIHNFLVLFNQSQFLSCGFRSSKVIDLGSYFHRWHLIIWLQLQTHLTQMNSSYRCQDGLLSILFNVHRDPFDNIFFLNGFLGKTDFVYCIGFIIDPSLKFERHIRQVISQVSLVL